MELRQRLDEVFDRLDVECGRGGWNALADAILAIPEIRDALSFQASSAALTKAAMGEGRYEKRGDLMVWVREGDEAIEQPQADY